MVKHLTTEKLSSKVIKGYNPDDSVENATIYFDGVFGRNNYRLVKIEELDEGAGELVEV